MFRAWLPVAGVLLLIGFVPACRIFCFCLLQGQLALPPGSCEIIPRKTMTESLVQQAGLVHRRAGPMGADENAEPSAPDRIELSDVTDNSPVSVQLGYGLIEMVDEQTGGPLINRITGIRKQISRNLGFVIPAAGA